MYGSIQWPKRLYILLYGDVPIARTKEVEYPVRDYSADVDQAKFRLKYNQLSLKMAAWWIWQFGCLLDVL